LFGRSKNIFNSLIELILPGIFSPLNVRVEISLSTGALSSFFPISLISLISLIFFLN
jgi:hypothetical protein